MSKQTHIVGVDLGTTSTTAIIAEAHEGELEVLGVGVAASSGVRKGAVVNPEAAADPIREAVEEAERMSGLVAESVYVSMSGTLLRGVNNHGVTAITHSDHHITHADIRRVIETASLVTLPGGYEIIEVHPQEYIVDGQDGISDPIEMLGTRLEVKVHIITGPMTLRRNVIAAVNRAGLLVAGVVLEPIAAAEAILTHDEREYGSVVINIGGETTSLAIYQRGAVQHTAIFPLGGSHFTSDIAFGLRTPIADAERIKREQGCVTPSLAMELDRTTVNVPAMGHRPSRTLSREILCQILQPRAEEILHHVRDELRRSGFERQLSSGAILTGGGALLKGLPALAEHILDSPARLGEPQQVRGIAGERPSALLTTALGLVLMGCRGRRLPQAATHHPPGRLLARTAARVRHWLSDLF